VSSTAQWLNGFEAGVRAERRGLITDTLMHQWIRWGGYIMVPGQAEVRRWPLDEWQEWVDGFVQKATGHNRVREPFT
jgi:hypothetical protein